MPKSPLPQFEDELQSFAMLGGLNAAQLWEFNNFVMFGWFLIAFLPRWKHTRTLSVIPPLCHSAVYTLAMISLIFFPEKEADPEVNFTTLKGVVTLFKDPNGVFVGWVHYVAFDLLVGRWIVFDSTEKGASLLFHAIVIVPCLFFTLMAGPVGFLLYMGMREVFLQPLSPKKKID